MFHYDHGTVSGQEGRQIPNMAALTSSMDCTTAGYDKPPQKTFEEIYLKVTVVRKSVICTMSPNGTKTDESPFYLEESSPVMMKMGEREIQHIPPSSDLDTPSWRKSEMNINSNLCEIIPLTELIGLRIRSTCTNKTFHINYLALESPTVVSELVPLAQNDLSNATHTSLLCYGKSDEQDKTKPILVMESKQTRGEIVVRSAASAELVNAIQNDHSNSSQLAEMSVLCYGRSEEKSETNQICLSESKQTVSESVMHNSITSESVHSNSKKQNNSTSSQCCNSIDLSFESSITGNKLSQSTGSRNYFNSASEWLLYVDGENSIIKEGLTGKEISESFSSGNERNNSSEWSLNDENGINKDGDITVPQNNDDLEGTEINRKETSGSEHGDGEINVTKPSNFEQTVESHSNTNSFEMEDVSTSLVSRQLRSATFKHKATCECKICKQSVICKPQQLESSDPKCMVCDKVFTSERCLKNHHLVHKEPSTSNDSYNCFCGLVFVSYVAFMEHGQDCEIQKRHNTIDQHVDLFCNKCKNEFKSERLFNNHKCVHHGKHSKYACHLCGSIFKTGNSLLKHQRKKCDPFFCSICCINCKDEVSLKKHLRTHSESTSKEQIHTCANCSRNFNSLTGFQKHQKHCCTEHRSYQIDEPWMCPKCKNSYTSQSSIYRHKVKGCLGEKIYKCDTCKKAFHTIEAVKEHVGIHKNMNEQGRYYCSACNKSYSQRSGYLKHKRKGLCDIGSVFSCSYCPKVFINETRRNWHQRMHPASENQQTHVCIKCGKEYFSARALQKHTQRNTCKKFASCTERKKDQKFVCEECGKVYSSTSALFKHKQNHRGYRPYACKFCNKSFCRPFILTQHIKIHTGDRQWLCSLCGKSFYTKSHLKRHQISHDKSQDNICNICDKRYAYKHDLSKHKKISHSHVIKESVGVFSPDSVGDEVMTSTMNIQNELMTYNKFM